MSQYDISRALGAAFIFVAACALFMALSRDIAITQFAEIEDVISTLFSIEAAEAAAGNSLTAEEYQAQIDLYSGMIQTFLFNSDTARLEYEALVKPTGYTVFESADALIKAGDVLPGLLIIGFSVIFPIVKTLITAVLAAIKLDSVKPLKWIEATHKYTMLDVFVVAVTLFAVSNQELLMIDPGPAVVWYVVYIVAGFVSVSLLKRSIEERASGGATPGADAGEPAEAVAASDHSS